MYLHQVPSSLLVQLDCGVHRKLNNVVESHTVVNILTCISQESRKSCYTSSSPRFYQELIAVMLGYSFSIFILILFNFSKSKCRREDSGRKREIKYINHLQ